MGTGANERLLRDGTPQELRNGAGDPVTRPPKARIFSIAGFGKRSRGSLPHHSSRPLFCFGVGFDGLQELEKEGRVFVPGEKPEQYPVSQLERPAATGPFQLEEPPVLRYGADVFDALGGRARETQQISAPDPVVFLLLDYRQRCLRFVDSKMGCLNDFGRGIPFGDQLPVGAISDRRPGVLQQPGNRDPVLGRQVQNRSRGTVGGSSGGEDMR
jgi:hypothetical protein